MNLSDLYKMIKRFEGCVLTAYQDSGGKWTIGWGSTGWDVIPGKPWTQEYADKRLEQDAVNFAKGVIRTCPWANNSQLCALSDFAYNLGLGNLRNSTLMRKFKRGDISGAASEFLRWNKIKGKVSRGLTIRRTAERELFLCG